MKGGKNMCESKLLGNSFCPPRPVVDEDVLRTFENCVPISGTSNTVANRIFQAVPSVNATIAASLESTNDVGFNVIITRITGGNLNFTVQPGSSITFVVEGILTIDLFSLSGTTYTGIFREQVSYHVPV